MPVVRKEKSRAKDFYDGAWKGRARFTKQLCSWFVLTLGIAVSSTVQVDLDLQTVICQVPSVSRESGAAAKLKQPADASLTICWCPFEQA
jgi:hypothetical protein